MLEEINKHPFDRRIKFRDQGHKYWIDGDDTDIISATSYIHQFFQEFNEDKVIKNILNSKDYENPDYKYYKMTIWATFLFDSYCIFIIFLKKIVITFFLYSF